MNAKKALEFRAKLAANDTGAQLRDFLAKKQNVQQRTKKSRYLTFLEQEMPKLQQAEHALCYSLSLDAPRQNAPRQKASLQKTSLQDFFALLPEE